MSPVSVCVAVTVTPGSTAPLSSVMRPLNWAVESCADAGVVMSRRVRAPTIVVRNRFITYSSPVRQQTMGEFGRRYYQRSGRSDLSGRDPTWVNLVWVGLHAVVFRGRGFGNEGARKVEANGVVEGKRNLVLHPRACFQRHTPDDPSHGVDFVAGTQFE